MLCPLTRGTCHKSATGHHLAVSEVCVCVWVSQRHVAALYADGDGALSLLGLLLLSKLSQVFLVAIQDLLLRAL